MPSQKIDPIKEFANLRDTVTRAIGQGIQSVTGGIYPLIDMYETDEAVILQTAPLEGLVPNSIEVAMEEDMLTIKGETKPSDEIQPEAYLQRERRFGPFLRTLRIPRAVDAEAAQAKVSGVSLTITLPKTADQRPQIIDVTHTE